MEGDNVLLIGLVRTQYYTYDLIYTIETGAREMALQIAVLATKHDHLSVISGPCMVEGEHSYRMYALIYHSCPSATIIFVSCLKKNFLCSKPTIFFSLLLQDIKHA